MIFLMSAPAYAGSFGISKGVTGNYKFTVPLNEEGGLFNFDNVEEGKTYKSTMLFENTSDVPMVISLTNVKDKSSDPEVYNISYLIISDEDTVFYDGKLGNAKFSVLLKPGEKDNITFGYSIPMRYYEDNYLMGKKMNASFAFAAEETVLPTEPETKPTEPETKPTTAPTKAVLPTEAPTKAVTPTTAPTKAVTPTKSPSGGGGGVIVYPNKLATTAAPAPETTGTPETRAVTPPETAAVPETTKSAKAETTAAPKTIIQKIIRYVMPVKDDEDSAGKESTETGDVSSTEKESAVVETTPETLPSAPEEPETATTEPETTKSMHVTITPDVPVYVIDIVLAICGLLLLIIIVLAVILAMRKRREVLEREEREREEQERRERENYDESADSDDDE